MSNSEERIKELQSDLIYARIENFRRMLATLADEQLGHLLRRYLEDSDFNSWEGFSFPEQLSIATMFNDMALFHDAGDDSY